jgi:RHS repeat-associated protein
VKIALPKISRPDKLRGVSSPAHRRFFPLAAWLLLCAWLCGILVPARVEAMTTSPAKIASWGAGLSASGRTGDPSTANQDGIRVGGLCAYESASGLPEWLSRDPIEEDGGLNLYGYVGNNPVSRNDPLGLWYWTNPASWGVGDYQGFNGGWNAWHGLPGSDGGGDYLDRYLHYVDQNDINPGPLAAALLAGPWPKSLSPATGCRGPLLGSNNPLTSVPRAFGFGGEWAEATAFRAVISPAIGVATVGAGFWNIGIYIGGLGAAAGWY